jgi:hypothetical protein
LAGDETTVGDCQRLAVSQLFKDGAKSHQLVLNEKWHDMAKLRLFPLAIREPRDAFALHQGLAFVSHETKYSGRILLRSLDLSKSRRAHQTNVPFIATNRRNTGDTLGRRGEQ